MSTLPYWVVPKTLAVLYGCLLLFTPLFLVLAAVTIWVMRTPPVLARIVNFWDRACSWWRRESLSCPNAGCYKAVELPIYVCPGCGHEHPELRPSIAGVWAHTCKCSKALPTRGGPRAVLPGLCPHCRKPLKVVREHTVRIPLVAGPSAGKTSYLVALMSELYQQSKMGRIGLAFPSENYERLFKESHEQLNCGVPPRKTPELSPDAFVGQLKDLVGNSVVFHTYDAAGELYEQADSLRNQAYLDKCSGFLFVLDPFALPDIQTNHAGTLAKIEDQVRPSAIKPQDAFDRLVLVLRERLEQSNGMLDRPIAVVITKADALGLIEEIRGEPGENGLVWRPVPHKRVRDWLMKNGAGNLVRGLESNFKHIGFFACSALGRLPDESGAAFLPRAVIHPMAWLLAHSGIQLEQAVAMEANRAKRTVYLARAAAVAAAVATIYLADAGIFAASAPATLRACATMGLYSPVGQLLAAGTNKEAFDGEGRTPLFLAADNGFPTSVRTLLEAGANPNAARVGGDRPLIVAAAANRPQIVELLLKHGADANGRNDTGATALYRAVENGNLPILAALLAAGADPNTKGPDGIPVAVAAYGRKNLEGLQALFAKGADADAADAQGVPLLHLAVKDRDAKGAEVILSAGANIATEDPEKMTPLVRAVELQDEGLVDLLLAHKAPTRAVSPTGDPVLYMALRKGGEPIVRKLLRAGAPRPDRDADGQSLVGLATARAELPMLRTLLDAGVSPRIADRDGDYPAHIAAHAGNGDLLDVLLRGGASARDRDRKGNDVPLLAALNQDMAMLESVVAAAPANDQNHAGDTLLTALIGESPAEGVPAGGTGADDNKRAWLAKMLVARGASLNLANGRGDTPLMAAVRRPYPRVAKILVDAGADFDKSGSHGASAASLAAQLGRGELSTMFNEIRARREEEARIAAEKKAKALEEAQAARAKALEEARARALEEAQASPPPSAQPQASVAPASAPVRLVQAVSRGAYVLRYGSYESDQEARAAMAELAAQGIRGQIYEGRGGVYHLTLGGFPKRRDAERRAAAVRRLGYEAVSIEHAGGRR